MYISKHYTCEEIDQRLLQGYYDDFVAAGFVGSKEEFWTFVLSISNKVDKEEGKGLSANDFTDELKAKLDSIQEGARTVTKVSELENDLEFQTKEQVEKYISDLVSGADQALDTLKELAEALGNDPNFAATIAGKLGELRTLLDGEITRATKREDELELSLNELQAKLDTKSQEILDLIATKEQEAKAKHEQLQEQITTNREDIIKFGAQLDNNLLEAKAYTDQKVLEEHDRARDAENKLQDDISTLANVHTTDKGELLAAITTEASNRESADSALSTRIDQLKSTHDQDLAGLRNNLETEIAQRQAGDESLLNSINTEETKRQAADQTLNEKIVSETTRATAAESNLNGSIQTEASERKAQDQVLDHKISDLSDTLTTTNTDLLEKLNEETQDRIQADNALKDSKVDKREGYGLSKNDFDDVLLNKLNNIEEFANYVTLTSQLINDSGYQTEEDVNQAISKVIDMAPEALDTLKELAEALGNDPNFAATITTRLTQLAEQLNQEVDNREKADLALQANIDKLSSKIDTSNDSVKAYLKEYVDNVANTLTILIENNTEAISSEAQARKDAITEVKQLIQNEATARANADTLHTAALDDIKTKFNDLNTSLTKSITDLRTELNDKIVANAQEIKSNADAIEVLQSKIGEVNIATKEELADINAKITKEVEDRTLADSLLESKIQANTNAVNNEVIRATTAEAVLQANIDTAAEAGKSANATLKSELVKELSDYKATVDGKIEDVKDLIADESVKRQTGDAALESKINALETTTVTKIEAVKQDLVDINNNLTREITRATTEETAIRNRIEALNENHIDDLAAVNSALGNKVDKVEGKSLSANDFTDELKLKLQMVEDHANYITKVSQLVNDSGYQTSEDVNQAIQDVIDMAPEALDTLRELADALGDDPNFAATINQRITELNNIIKEQGKDVDLVKEQLSDIKDRNNAQDGLIAQNVANIQRNFELISQIKSDYFQAIDSLKEIVDKALQDLEHSQVEIDQKLDAEIAKREEEDQILDNKITAEADRAKLAEQELREYLDEEIAARKAVTGIIGQVYEPDVSTNYLGEAGNLMEADVQLDAQIKNTNNKLNDEVIRAKAAEKTLTDNLTAEVNRATNAEQTLTDNLAAEVTRAKAAEKLLSDNLAAETTRATNAEQTITNNLNAEIAARKAVDGETGQTYSADQATNYLKSVGNLKAADKELDKQIKLTNDELSTHHIKEVDNVTIVKDTNGVIRVNYNDIKTGEAHTTSSTGMPVRVCLVVRDGKLATETTALTYTGLRAINANARNLVEEGALYKHLTEIQSAEDNITANLNAEITRAKAAEKKLTDDLAAEVTNRTNADTAINQNINLMKANLVKILGDNSSANTSSLETVDTELASLGDNYKSLYEIGKTLKTFLEATDTANSTINRWQEIESFLNGITDTETLTGILDNLHTEINNETTTALTAEINRAKAAEKALADDLATRLIKDVDGTTIVKNKNGVIRVNYRDDIKYSNTKYEGSDEAPVYARFKIDNDLGTLAVEAVVNSYNGVDRVPGNYRNLVEERALREYVSSLQDADTTLTNNLNAEITRAKAAEKAISDNLATHHIKEVDDVTITKDANGVIKFKGSSYKLSELSTGTGTNPISASLGTDGKVNIKLSIYDASREISSTSNGIVTEKALARHLTDLNTNTTTVADNLAAEITRAKAAEKTLTDNLASEVTNRTNADTAEANRAKAAEKTLTDNLTAEINRAKSVEGNISDALADEEGRAKAAEKKLTDDLAAAVARISELENILKLIQA